MNYRKIHQTLATCAGSFKHPVFWDGHLPAQKESRTLGTCYGPILRSSSTLPENGGYWVSQGGSEGVLDNPGEAFEPGIVARPPNHAPRGYELLTAYPENSVARYILWLNDETGWVDFRSPPREPPSHFKFLAIKTS
jgi:hypothetical protein